MRIHINHYNIGIKFSFKFKNRPVLFIIDILLHTNST